MITTTKSQAPFDVLHVTPYMHPLAGGPPVVVDRLCRGLMKHGWSSQVVCTDTLAPHDDRRWVDELREAYPLDVFSHSGPGSYSFSRKLAVEINRRAKHCRLMHLHTVWTYPTWVAMRACRRHGIPYVVMPHGMLDPHSLSRKLLKKQVYGRLIEWPNLRRASAMVYTHQAERELAVSAVTGLAPGYIVPLGSDDPPNVPRTELADEFLACYPQLRDKAVVMFLSRLHAKKGLDLLIPAFAKVVKRFPGARLALVGPGEVGYVAFLKGLVNQAGLSNLVTFTGPLEGRMKWAALAAARVFALPSYQENFALVVVEAQRLGVPVVISRRINIWQDIVSAGGGVVAELTSESIADQILPFLLDRRLAIDSGRRGKEFVYSHFNWDRTIDNLCDVYRTVLRS